MVANFHWSENLCVSPDPYVVSDLRPVNLRRAPNYGLLPDRAVLPQAAVDDFDTSKMPNIEPFADIRRQRQADAVTPADDRRYHGVGDPADCKEWPDGNDLLLGVK